MPRKHAEQQVAIHAAATALVATVGPRLTPIPVDPWVMRGHSEIADELERQGERLADLSPAAVTSLLDLIERTLAARHAVQAWMPVTQAMPEADTVVLAWHRHLRHVVLEYGVQPGDEAAGLRWFTMDCERVDGADVLAWRPLPPDWN